MRYVGAGFAATLAAAAMAGTAWQALADNTDEGTVNVGGTIVQSLTATASIPNITMPDLVRPNASEANTTVNLLCGTSDAMNTVQWGGGSADGNGNPFADGVGTATSAGNGTPANSSNDGVAGALSTGTCAEVDVSGEPNFHFQVEVSAVAAPTTGTGVTVAAVTCYDGSTGSPVINTLPPVLDASGDLTIRCGALVSADSTATNYSGADATVTVTYD